MSDELYYPQHRNNSFDNIHPQSSSENLSYFPETIKNISLKKEQLIVTDTRILDQYICLICQEFPFEPVECITPNETGKPCGALCCKKCYYEYMSSDIRGKKCPLKCSSRKMKVKDAIHLKEIFDLLIKVKCTQCKKNFKYSDYSLHLEKCENRNYICRNCGFKGQLKNIEKHLNNCPEGKILCYYCSLELKRKDKEHHEKDLCLEVKVKW